MKRPLKLLLSMLLVTGCSLESNVELTQGQVPREPGDLIELVSGYWLVMIEVEGDCPEEWAATFPHGQTRWRDEGTHLVIEQIAGASALELYSRDESSLYFSATIESAGCILTDHQSLTLQGVTDDYAHGSFEQVLTQDGVNCRAIIGTALPERCSTYIRWQGYR